MTNDDVLIRLRRKMFFMGGVSQREEVEACLKTVTANDMTDILE